MLQNYFRFRARKHNIASELIPPLRLSTEALTIILLTIGARCKISSFACMVPTNGLFYLYVFLTAFLFIRFQVFSRGTEGILSLNQPVSTTRWGRTLSGRRSLVTEILKRSVLVVNKMGLRVIHPQFHTRIKSCWRILLRERESEYISSYLKACHLHKRSFSRKATSYFFTCMHHIEIRIREYPSKSLVC